MKIQLKISANELFYLQTKLEKYQSISPAEFLKLDRKGKSKISLFMDCFDKIKSKCDSVIKKHTVFEEKKQFLISLKYHEATIINNLCCGLKDSEIFASYYKHLANKIFLQLDEKL